MSMLFMIPSGNLLHSYEKWRIEIVHVPIKSGESFRSELLVITRGYLRNHFVAQKNW